MDRTLILVKPDAFSQRLTGEIIGRFERKGLQIVAMRLTTMDRELAERHYAEHEGKSFYGELVDFITSGPLVAMVLEGAQAVAAARQVIGATDPLEATPGSIRGDLAIEVGTNLVHGSDSPESAEREVALFFPDLAQVAEGEALAADLILASASPRRRAILEQLGLRFEVVPVDVEELHEGDPREVARENAARKARAAAAQTDRAGTVVGVDTVVALDGQILPKPRDAAQAREWLRALSGRDHGVTSAICMIEAGRTREAVSATEVRFRSLTGAEIDWYVASDEWRDKAGGYAIQARGAALVESISGDYWTVVGLPVPALLDLLGPGVLTAR